MTQRAQAILWGIAIVGAVITLCAIAAAFTIGDITNAEILKQNIETCLATNGQPILSAGKLIACVR